MTEQNRALPSVCWTTTAILAGFACFTQLGMMLSFLLARHGITVVAPMALVVSMLVADRFAQSMGLALRNRIWAIGLALGVVAIGTAISAYFFDFSWDGQWYHQTAIYALANNWNPLTDPLRAFPTPARAELWVRHYPKGTWYVAAAIFDATGRVELGKCENIIAWAAMAFATCATALEFGMKRSRAAALAIVVAANPVVLSEITTFLVDGVMIAYLTVTAAAIFSALRQPKPIVIYIGLLAAIATANAKLTGLVFLCFALAAGAIWCAFFFRRWLLRYCAWSALALILAVGVFGFNPYVTNTIYRHNPFYPQSGSKAYPSLDDQNNQGIEHWETPKNFLPRNRFTRLFLANFGRPGNQPYRKELNSTVIWPFTARYADLFYYHYHDIRVAAFGPWFSGALVLSFALAIWNLWKRTSTRGTGTLVALTIFLSVIISPVLWWARYGPQLWLLPTVPILITFWASPSRLRLAFAWTILAVLVINAAIVGTVRLKWDALSAQTLRRELADLAKHGTQIVIDFSQFTDSGEGRLKAWGINYKVVSRTEVRRVHGARELMSVVDGYPGATNYRVIKSGAVPETNR